MKDWVAQLAKQSIEKDKSTTTSATAAAVSTTKAERIEKRQVKKRRREDRRAELLAQRPNVARQSTQEESINSSSKSSSYKKLLRYLAGRIQERVDTTASSLPKKPYKFDKETRVAPTKKRKWDEYSIQPRNRDYGGIGLARPTLFLPFDDPSFFPRLEQEFLEHIPGFFGKTRTKAMKKQLDGNMLWKKLQNSDLANKKVNGKKLKDMKPDERVEAMIEAGLV